MRRRRQKNPLLMRIIVISICVHILLLPVLAHYGAFKKIQQHFIETQMVTLPPPPQEKIKPEVRKTAHTPHKVASHQRHAAPAAQHARSAAQRTAMNHPPVVAAPGAGGEDNGDGVNPNGTGKAGEVPTEAKKPQTATTAPASAPEPKPTPKPVEASKPVEAPKPTPKPVEAPTPKPEPPREPVFTEAVAMNAPQPSIPDDLRAAALDKTCVTEFTVQPDGSITDMRIDQSSGNDELDRIALATARQYKFKPALRDGQPVASRVRVHIEFQVS